MRTKLVAVSVVGGLLALALVAFNLLELLDEPSYGERMQTADQYGVSPAEYSDAYAHSIAIGSAIASVEAASRSYYRAVPLDQGSQVINGSAWIADLDAWTRPMADLPALDNPALRDLYDAYVAELEVYRESRQGLISATDVSGPVLAVCNPYALPVHTPRDPANADVLTGCIEDLTDLGATGDPVVDAMIVDSLPSLQQWASSLDPDSTEADVARDAYLAAFTEAAEAGSAQLEPSSAPVREAQEQLLAAAERLKEPPR